MRLLKVIGLVLALAIAVPASATIDQYEFDNIAASARYMALIEELRCPKCQNQNLADSNAEIAQDMRDEIYRLMDQGLSDQQIVEHLVSRYGDFVRYKPPVNEQTAVLWLVPALLLFLAVCVVVFLIISQAKRASKPSVELSDDEKRRLQQLTEEEDQ